MEMEHVKETAVREEKETLPDLFRHLFDGTSAVCHHERSSLGCGDGDDNHTCQHHDVYLQDKILKNK